MNVDSTCKVQLMRSIVSFIALLSAQAVKIEEVTFLGGVFPCPRGGGRQRCQAETSHGLLRERRLLS